MIFLGLIIKVKRKLFALGSCIAAKVVVKALGVSIGKHVLITSIPYVFRYKGSSIVIGNDVRMHANLFQNPVCGGHKMVLATYSPNAVIDIGEGAAISCATIAAYKQVKIGKRVFIGAGAQILDTDFHPIKFSERQRTNQIDLAGAEAIEIRDDVWLGAECVVLKGVTIGKGAVVAARAVVTKDVASHTLVAGVPAKVIKVIEQ